MRLKHTMKFGFAMSVAMSAILLAATSASAAAPQVAAGGAHTCALRASGELLCFGSNEFGQLGSSVPTPGAGSKTDTPQTVTLAAVKQIAAGLNHTCALLSAGTVWCFGSNQFGQLGNATNSGNPNANDAPLQAGLTGPASAIFAGGNHTCALLASGAFECFGQNDAGQLGTTANSSDNPTPNTVTFSGAATASSAALGASHTCVLMSNSTVECFGSAAFGQLGNGMVTATPQPSPSPTNSLGQPAKAVAAGGDHTCVLLNDGMAKCFGSNAYGELGVNPDDPTPNANNPLSTPTLTAVNSAAIAIAAGANHTCALLADGSLRCFGLNVTGQLGNDDFAGTTAINYFPLNAGDPSAVIGITAGTGHTCAWLSTGVVRCVGDNSSEQIGAPFSGYQATPPYTIASLMLVDPAPVVPVTPPPTPPAKLRATISVNGLKSKPYKDGKRRITGAVYLTAKDGNAGACTGKVSLTVKRGSQKLALKTYKIKYAAGRCGAKISLTVSSKYRKYAGKQVSVSVALTDSSTLTANTRTVRRKL